MKSTDQKKIVHQKKRITALEELLVYYKEITETIREPFLILDKDMRVVSANLAFYRKFKVRKKDTEGRHIFELGNNQWNSPDLRDLLEGVLPTNKMLKNYEVTHDFPDLGTKTMILNARQVDSKQLILLAIDDVTVERKLKLDLDKLTKSLTLQRDQLQGLNDAKDEFISLASHQLRTPATVVKQYVSMLTHGYAGDVTKPQLRMLNVAYQSNERQLEIIEDLLRVAKVDAGKVYLDEQPCDIGQEMEAVIQEQAVLFASRGQTVILNKPKTPVIAVYDQRLMHMVLENLLDNAGKYSDPGQKITVGISSEEGGTVVSVADRGVGIRKKDYDKLFKRFSRIDNPLSTLVGGTGLGLYWARKILDLHGGSIEVTSKVKGGTTFTVRIPSKKGQSKLASISK